MLALLPALFPIVKDVIDKVVPDKNQAQQAKDNLERAHLNGELKVQEQQLKIALSDAKSPDKWTSRARPSFLYVMYIMILFSIPMGFLYAAFPTFALNVIKGWEMCLHAIPHDMWLLFGGCFGVYSGCRTFDKRGKQ